MPVRISDDTVVDAVTPTAGGKRRLTLVTLCLAVLIAQIDTSVVNLAVQPIGQYFKTGVGSLQWVVDSYNLVYAICLLTGGLLADLYGRRRVFMAGAAVFTLASLLCALSPDIVVLVGGRALAGFGAALMLPASLAIVRVVWSDARSRGKALGIWAACGGAAFAIGPSIGGLLIAHFGWRSIFFLVLPLGLAALPMAPRHVPESSDRQHRHFDATGQAFGALALGALVLAAIESQRLPNVAGAALAAALLSALLFIKAEQRCGPGALIPPEIFRVRAFRGAMIATSGMTFGMYGVAFLVPLVWQGAGTLGAAGAGIALMPMALVFVLTSTFSGRLAERLGTRSMTAGGVAIIGGGVMLIGVTANAASLAATEAGLVLTGIGMGLATGPLTGVAVGAVAAARSGSAAALINVARMVGATLGVAILGAVYTAGGAGQTGLELAMLCGGAAQIVSAALMWRAVPATETVAA